MKLRRMIKKKTQSCAILSLDANVYIMKIKNIHIKFIFIIVVATVAIIGVMLFYYLRATKPIKVGILHSLTGAMAISEKHVVDATLMAIDELNKKGGLLGRTIEPIVVDGQSDGKIFAQEAERLVLQEKVDVIFGCWTSATRKVVEEVVRKYNNLLFYPVQYEGIEDSPYIAYTGATANQQVIPSVTWCFEHIGKRIFLVGSDYVFPRTINNIIRAQVAVLDGEVVGEEYMSLNSTDASTIVEKIKQTKPDVILNSLNGENVGYFFKALRNAGIMPSAIPTMSFSIGEPELKDYKDLILPGDYIASNYFQSIDSEVNREFIKKFKDRYGADRLISDPMVSAYVGPFLWAQAVLDAGLTDPEKVRSMLKNQTKAAPSGIVYIDNLNQHTWKIALIGKIESESQVAIVWSSLQSIAPIPYPPFKSKQDWESFLTTLYVKWGHRWSS